MALQDARRDKVKRKPVVSGYFYPGKKKQLREMLGRMINPETPEEKALCVISPHAGYVYSGSVAGAVFASTVIPDRAILLGPSHRYGGDFFSLANDDSWETPLGDVFLDTEMTEFLINSLPHTHYDSSAHSEEHSLEVLLPFLQQKKPSVKIMPVCVGPQVSLQQLITFGESLAQGLKKFDRDVLLVVSTDMSHYISHDSAKKKDSLAIEQILNLNPEGLHETVARENISMCGFQPTVAALKAAQNLGARKAELIQYQTSGEASGDYSEVVGYAGIRII
jgi:AmmeMemoRadiSam system protein B